MDPQYIFWKLFLHHDVPLGTAQLFFLLFKKLYLYYVATIAPSGHCTLYVVIVKPWQYHLANDD